MNPFLVLGVPLDVDEAALRAAYRAQAKATHPDTATPENAATAAENFRQVRTAFEILSNPLSRAAAEIGARAEYRARAERNRSKAGALTVPVGPLASHFTLWEPPAPARVSVHL